MKREKKPGIESLLVLLTLRSRENIFSFMNCATMRIESKKEATNEQVLYSERCWDIGLKTLTLFEEVEGQRLRVCVFFVCQVKKEGGEYFYIHTCIQGNRVKVRGRYF
jgi:glycyl-tRNA synthetase (class II)